MIVDTRLLILKNMYWNTGKLNLFLFLLDTCCEQLGNNETLTAAETTQSLISESYAIKI